MFLKRYSTDASVLHACLAVLHAFCSATDTCVSRIVDVQGVKAHESVLTSRMHELRDMISETLASVSAGEARISQQLNLVEHNVVAGLTLKVADSVKALLMDSLTTVKDAARNAADQLNPTSIAEVVTQHLLGTKAAEGLGPLADAVREVLVMPLQAVQNNVAKGLHSMHEAILAAKNNGQDDTAIREHEIQRKIRTRPHANWGTWYHAQPPLQNSATW